MKKSVQVTVVALAVLFAVGAARAQTETDPRAVPVFHAAHGVPDVLRAAVGKKVLVLVLEGGTRYVGKVKAVGDHAVVLTELQGKEFFDAYIPIASIVALEERVRLR